MDTPRIKWSEYCESAVRYAQTAFQGRNGHHIGRMPTIQELMQVEAWCPAGPFNRIDCWPPARVPLWQYNPPRYPAARDTA